MRTVKMSKDIEDYEVECWDGEFVGPTCDEQENLARPKRRTPRVKPPRTKLQQLELDLEYDIDEI